ncbi:hypothetical protein AJ80_07332 [Polytolypa hystricis UAMH7299]|uniref:Uncharacterized protein n=1 Tax=Polytolypa hystricis (strain UAMH7299) TaxID=1447883 RepID=A0A2B7XPH8_POLH7|nr:hypothetical protein AJ80_07332 [Polytolypa hystricis UAMH7299]
MAPITPEEAYERQEQGWELPMHLPPNTSVYQYSGFTDLQGAVSQAYEHFSDNNQSPIVGFTGISQEELEKHIESIPGRIDYYPTLHTLILTILSYPHELAAGVTSSLWQ